MDIFGRRPLLCRALVLPGLQDVNRSDVDWLDPQSVDALVRSGAPGSCAARRAVLMRSRASVERNMPGSLSPTSRRALTRANAALIVRTWRRNRRQDGHVSWWALTIRSS